MAEKTYSSDTALMKVFWLGKCLGAFPFDSQLTPTAYTVSWSIFIIVGAILLSFCHRLTCALSLGSVRRTVKVALANVSNVFSLFVILMHRRSLLSLRENIISIERKLSAEGIVWVWDKKIVSLLRYHILFGISIVFGVMQKNVSTISAISLLQSYLGPFPILLTIISQFTSLQDIFASLIDSLVLAKNTDTLVRAATALQSAADDAQRIYGLQILFYTTCAFVFIICNVYYEIVADYTIDVTIHHMTWTALFFVALMEIITSCNKTTDKARKLNASLYDRAMEEDTDILLDNDLLEFHLICNKELIFSAYGVFPLNNSAVCSMAASAVTYLVVLLQLT